MRGRLVAQRDAHKRKGGRGGVLANDAVVPTRRGRGSARRGRRAGATTQQRRSGPSPAAQRPRAQPQRHIGKIGRKKETTAVVHTYIPPPLPCGGVGAAAWQLRSKVLPLPTDAPRSSSPSSTPRLCPRFPSFPTARPIGVEPLGGPPRHNRYTSCTATPPPGRSNSHSPRRPPRLVGPSGGVPPPTSFAVGHPRYDQPRWRVGCGAGRPAQSTTPPPGPAFHKHRPPRPAAGSKKSKNRTQAALCSSAPWPPAAAVAARRDFGQPSIPPPHPHTHTPLRPQIKRTHDTPTVAGLSTAPPRCVPAIFPPAPRCFLPHTYSPIVGRYDR